MLGSLGLSKMWQFREERQDEGGYVGPYLPGGRVSSEIGEHPGEPVIDLIQSQLPIWSFQNGLRARMGKETLSLDLEATRPCLSGLLCSP